LRALLVLLPCGVPPNPEMQIAGKLRLRQLGLMWELFALFGMAFSAATLLPFPSEPLFLALIAKGTYGLPVLLAVATIGNTLGSCVNWALGRWIERFRDQPRFPLKGDDFDKTQRLYQRWGVWSLLLGWAPVIGDPLTVMAGVMRTPLWKFVLLTGLGKCLRYLAVAGIFKGLFG
jgi:membrane protein YqaA with SNARE-associated domain